MGRVEMLSHVLCVHDTTEFSWVFRDDTIREHLGRLSARLQGFRLHTSIVTSAEYVRAPLGTVAVQPCVHHSLCPNGETLAAFEACGGIFANEK